MSDQSVIRMPTTKWPAAVRFFHWLSVVFLLLIFSLIVLHENTDGAGGLYISLHKAFGISFFFWIVFRLANRVRQQAQQPQPVVAPRWQQLSASLVHSLLYVVLLMMPLTGFLMTQFGGRPTNMFGLFEIPLLLTPDREMGRLLNQMHTDFIWTALVLLTLSHVGAALYHQFVKKDGTLKRMR
ncbi:MAG: cytochrome b/b6 domain-containing protein [Moraxellaceae bacterium]